MTSSTQPAPSRSDFFDAIFPPPMSAALLAYIVVLQRHARRRQQWRISCAVMGLSVVSTFIPFPHDIGNIIAGFWIGVISMLLFPAFRYQNALAELGVAQARLNEWYGIPPEVVTGITVDDAFKRLEDARIIEYMNCPAGMNGTVYYGTIVQGQPATRKD